MIYKDLYIISNKVFKKFRYNIILINLIGSRAIFGEKINSNNVYSDFDIAIIVTKNTDKMLIKKIESEFRRLFNIKFNGYNLDLLIYKVSQIPLGIQPAFLSARKLVQVKGGAALLKRSIDLSKIEPFINKENVEYYIQSANRRFNEGLSKKYPSNLICYRDAFNFLYEAARTLITYYMYKNNIAYNYENLKSTLPADIFEKYKEIYQKCHILYYYEMKFNLDEVQELFNKYVSLLYDLIDQVERYFGTN